MICFGLSRVSGRRWRMEDGGWIEGSELRERSGLFFLPSFCSLFCWLYFGILFSLRFFFCVFSLYEIVCINSLFRFDLCA